MSEANPLHQALMLMQQQAYSRADAICQQLLAQNPRDFNARHLLGVIKLQSGNPLAAGEELKQAASLPVAPRFKAQALSNLSLALQQQERIAEALEAIDQALSLAPDEQAFHLNRLNLLESMEHWQAMVDAATQFPPLHHLPDAQYPLARAARKRGEIKTALKRLDSAASVSELAPDALSERALLLILCGQEQRLWSETSKLDASELQMLADYMAEEGEGQAAQLVYQVLLERFPEHAGARHMLDAARGHIEACAPATYVRDLYDSHAERFEQQLVGRLGYRAPELLAERLQQILPLQIGQVADLGCGSGLLGRALRQRFEIEQLRGCDLSAGMLEQARRQGGYDELCHQELLDWLSRQANLNLVCATDVLIYTGDLQPVMRAVAASLSADGLFAFSVEDCASELRLSSSGRYQHSETHVRQRARETGLDILSCERFPLREEQGKMQTGLMVICRLSCNSEREA
ncbi:methyltransferase domain-containing protein [Marinobacterium sp. D7]|uniref:methyltransferase n=1 Tax=Marinobacterium ramblicola TaxID=2849041 RepID=UPI001C2CD41F|nr:methyltransferase [Marinobacterium ramblicola]MBV1788582.1 methyltransferase domain-containing protein [Marinobacterium ramblicola]